ncbi:antiterminator [Megasphaera cerevisiae DSM 20462]|uniref:Antiterminator n=1 Tax=Megasphaera cerevisiae DSM 20462 TaxID=1122219 RepID=A0A0J6ZLZ2_9FIRM|nr:glycerol-3-phosphate responsive antiterminator [Megasphaera cerevisiae]KMO85906.1 antiterminator [Megasphaera cerevisiae DSM 20462]OKY52330.1 antiterminator [Megasphaera cerevisiae]SKA07726.1 glycerol uptake operon antiterminator [Megasphaera cerevisiae DSM 20462]
MNKKRILIPSVRDIRYLDKALQSPQNEILLSTIVHIGNLIELTNVCHKAHKKVIVNHELIGGLSNDVVAFEMLKKMYKIDTVIGTNPYFVSRAKAVGLKTILKIPLIDSLSLELAIKSIESAKPDSIELRPAICACDFLDKFRRIFPGKIFACGFVNNVEMVKKLYYQGFDRIMTSTQELWNINCLRV